MKRSQQGTYGDVVNHPPSKLIYKNWRNLAWDSPLNAE
jgi:hypothetical protein